MVVDSDSRKGRRVEIHHDKKGDHNIQSKTQKISMILTWGAKVTESKAYCQSQTHPKLKWWDKMSRKAAKDKLV